ncbi:unnamed protein product, partial [Tenebrio molitor]
MDLEIIETIFTFGKFAALTPSSMNNHNPHCLQKLYEICVFVFYVVSFALSAFVYRTQYAILTPIQFCILAVAIIFTYISHSLYVLVVVNLQKHCKWFKLLASLKNTQCYKNNQNLYCLQFVMSHLITLSVIVVDVYFYCIYYDTPLALFNLIFCIEMYLQLFYLVLRCIILEMLLSRYHHQNNVLQRATVLVKVLKQIKQGVLTLKRCVNVFNSIFGWTILGSTFSGALSSFVYIDLAVKDETYFAYLWRDLGLRLYFFAEIAFLLLLWVGTIGVILLCDFISK